MSRCLLSRECTESKTTAILSDWTIQFAMKDKKTNTTQYDMDSEPWPYGFYVRNKLLLELSY